METLEPKTHTRDLTRGGQNFMHSVRMLVQVFRYAFFSALFLLICFFIGLVLVNTTPRNRYLTGQYIEAQLKLSFNIDAYNHLQNPPGTKPPIVTIPSKRFVQEPMVKREVNNCLKGIFKAFEWSLSLSMGALVLFLVYLKEKGRRAKITESILGHGRVTPKVLKGLLKAKGKASTLTLGGVPLLANAETQHILLAGTTGTGKSVCIQELMDQVRAKGQKAIVFDIDGTLIANYFRPGKDIILNPLDERCPPWNIWQECQDKADYEAIADSLMPEHLVGHDPFWLKSAQTIFTEVALALWMKTAEKIPSNQTLLELLFKTKSARLSTLVAGTPAEPLVSDQNEKMALSIQATLSTYCKALLYLRDDTQGNLFSIRRWIREEEQDSWLFIATDAQKSEALKPLLSVWLDVATKSVLSLPPFAERRIWFFVDELPKLHRLPSLQGLLERGRKYGACFVGSVQDIHQVHAVYGRNNAETLTSLFNTKIFFRSQEPESIAWMSKTLGTLELIEKKEGFSYGANDMRDGVSIHRERRREAVVKETEFLELPDLQAFLKLPGAWPVTKIELEIRDKTYNEPYFIPRDISKVVIPEVSSTKTTEVSKDKKLGLKKNKKKGSKQKENTLMDIHA